MNENRGPLRECVVSCLGFLLGNFELRLIRAMCVASLVLSFLSLQGFAQSMSREEVLQAIYPGATFVAERLFLTDAQRKRASELGEVEIESSLVARYTIQKDGESAGRAYVDSHLVRTKRESLLVCLDSNGKVKSVEVVAFLEPPEYKASPAWYDQFNGRQLSPDLRLDRGIRRTAGATLTSAAGVEAVRRVTALDQVLSGVDRRGQE